MIQSLEARRLLSANVDFDPEAGVLWVIGSDKRDRIEVSMGTSPLAHIDGSSAIIRLLGLPNKPGNYVNVFDEGRLIHQRFFAGQTLREVSLAGGGGDDALSSVNFNAPVLSRVFGDDGDDQIQAVTFDSAPGAEIYAGEGNDQIRVIAGRGASAGFIVWGEGGDDIIYGSSMNDTLLGDIDETLDRPPVSGNDIIFAGAGDDLIFGGDGEDLLYGQEGNDFLHGGGGADLLDGGAGEDTGVFDLLDKVVDIEKLTEMA